MVHSEIDIKMRRLTANIRGRVQGVSFRYNTQSVAKSLSLTGWVRNEPDGSVTAVAEGSQESLEQFLRFLNQGPRGARVTSVDNSWSMATREFADFEIRWI